MHSITEADREAAKLLREVLADVSGFWHRNDDNGALCQALAAHRIDAEKRLADKLAPFLIASPQAMTEVPSAARSRLILQESIALPRLYGPVDGRALRRSKS